MVSVFFSGAWILLVEIPEVIVIAFTDVIYQHLPPPLAIPSATTTILVGRKYL